MRSFRTAQLNRGFAGLVMICLIAALTLLACSSFIYAAASATEVKVPYTQVYDADGNRTNDSFTYQVKALNGAPAPQGSRDGVYYFTVKAVPGSEPVNGELDLEIGFSAPGAYSYEVSACAADREEGFTYESRTYRLNVYVEQDGNGGLSAAMVTLLGDNGLKYGRLQLNPGHASETLAPDEVRPTTTPAGDGTVPDRGVRTDGNGVTVTEDVQEPEAETESTLTRILDNVVPKAAPDRRYCSMINMLLTLLTVMICAAMYSRYFGRIDSEDDEYIIRRGGSLRLASAVPALISAVTFLCTEDLGEEKLWLSDEWTLLFAGMLAAAMVIAAVAAMKYDRDIKLKY